MKNTKIKKRKKSVSKKIIFLGCDFFCYAKYATWLLIYNFQSEKYHFPKLMFCSLEINKHQPFLYFSLDFVQILTGTPQNSPFKIP